jgi:D-3-phosphoglycerate dehydrogenase
MFYIKCLNPIAQIGLDHFTENYKITDSLTEADAFLVRSANLHDLEFPESLKAIARAGAGVNNIPIDKCSERGIVVFNTPGANANGVKEIVLAALFLASRDIIGGVNWVNSVKDDPEIANIVEKKKSNFGGIEISGKKLGVIGLGAIGALVANACIKLGMEVYGYDPYISVRSAWTLSKYIKPSKSLEDIFRNATLLRFMFL